MSTRHEVFTENRSVVSTWATVETETATLNDLNVVSTVEPDPEPVAPPAPISVGGGKAYDSVKRLMDICCSLIMIICAVPFIGIGAFLVRLTSKGSAFYSQIRVGKGGRPYTIYKIRSMYQDCEQVSGIRWSTKGDNRVTPVGRVLRKTHIDELPQLWNILKGDMSLIGPRPERPEIVPSLIQNFPQYKDRLLVAPGLAGLAQIQLPPDSDLESVKKKLELDRSYVYHRSFSLDMRIFIATAFYLVGLSFAKLKNWFWLPGPLNELPVVQSEASECDTVIERSPVVSAVPAMALEQA